MKDSSVGAIASRILESPTSVIVIVYLIAAAIAVPGG
jgi:hypothetical protein